MRHAVVFYKDLVQVPPPMGGPTHPVDALTANLGGEHRPEPVPPIPYGLVADLNAPLVQQIFDVAERQWKPDVEHHRQANDLGACFEVTEGGRFCHPGTLAGRPSRLKRSSSDNTVLQDAVAHPFARRQHQDLKALAAVLASASELIADVAINLRTAADQAERVGQPSQVVRRHAY